ncbi:diacylglycerol lipase-alpha-like isoform X2 [Tigriopus californicus]|uniref:diacylglycerol lipase-alpha-like isoform X2 n=1 Tax=Tigriopus californicus TaxID=6832 RepID=UPI0027DAAFCD|nr:diacylglycerol lipase-alpha-like isoform X2 [Tigriopus californicus]
MPGVIAFRRRWAVGSDDMIVPASFLIGFHLAWLFSLSLALYEAASTSNVTLAVNFPSNISMLFDPAEIFLSSLPDSNSSVSETDSAPTTMTFLASSWCHMAFVRYVVCFLLLWGVALLVELAIALVSLRGTIFEDQPRRSIEFLLYLKLVLWVLEIGLSVLCFSWLKKCYDQCSLVFSLQNVILALVICNLVIFFTAVMTLWCSFDVAGRSWVKLKKYQANQRDQNSRSRSKFQYKRSGGRVNRSWRHRKVRRAYQNSWDHRCQMLLCCAKSSNPNKQKNSFSDIARVLSEFFRDLDVVPSDVLVGLVLLRKRQQLLRLRVVHQPNNPVYQFLSGVKITPETKFLSLNDPTEMSLLREVYHYMHFALGVYGWPMYFRKNSAQSAAAFCKLCASLRCICFPCCGLKTGLAANAIIEGLSVVIDDNCCGCNLASYSHMCNLPNVQLVYITYHVDVGETPFLIAVDLDQRVIVICIRGTLSFKDVITDLNAEGEPLPIRPVNEDWIGHKGMVDVAAYVYRKLKDDHLLTKAFGWNKDHGTQDFGIVCVGHSLGAGAAAILAIMLRQEFPNTRCFGYSPPGGTLSRAAMEYTKEFMTSVVVGKDLVPRIGLHQLEELRHDLMYALQKSPNPKWLTLSSSLMCCGKQKTNYFDSPTHCWTQDEIEEQLNSPKGSKCKSSPEAINIHPWDSTINLSVHMPFFPPGKIIHLVRHYPKAEKHGKVEPVYQAIWADNTSFDQVLISKRMVQDHMPDKVLEALDKLLKAQGPSKPRRSMTGSIHTIPDHLIGATGGHFEPSLSVQEPSSDSVHDRPGVVLENNLRMETSFTTETVVTEPRELKGDASPPDESDLERASDLSETRPLYNVAESIRRSRASRREDEDERKREMKPIKASNSIKLLRQKERNAHQAKQTHAQACVIDQGKAKEPHAVFQDCHRLHSTVQSNPVGQVGQANDETQCTILSSHHQSHHHHDQHRKSSLQAQKWGSQNHSGRPETMILLQSDL